MRYWSSLNVSKPGSKETYRSARVRRGEPEGPADQRPWTESGKLAGGAGKREEPFNLGRLIRPVKEYHLLNPVIVDCTSSRGGGSSMLISRAKASMVTPNKRPTPRRWITTISCVCRREVPA